MNERTSSIETIQLHSVTLLNISDHITRSLSTQFGILLGTINNHDAVAHTSFEIIFNDSGSIDLEYLHKRLKQFQIVNPQYVLIGVYGFSNEHHIIENVYEQMKSVVNEYPLTCTIIHVNEVEKIEDHNIKSLPFQSYLNDFQHPIKTILSTSESEYIATTTAVNNRNYFTNESAKDEFSNDLPMSQYKENVSAAVNHLHDKLQKLIQYLRTVETFEGKSPEYIEKTIEINNKIVHLANKIDNSSKYNQQLGVDLNEKLQTPTLSLLTDQLAALEGLKSQIAKIIIRDGMTQAQIGTSREL